MLFSPYDFMISGCQICRPLLTAVLPARTTLSNKTFLFVNTCHKLAFSTLMDVLASSRSLLSSQSRWFGVSHRASAGLSRVYGWKMI